MNPSSKALGIKQVYSELDRKFEEQETQKKASEQNIAYMNLFGFPVDTQVLGLIDKNDAEAMGVVAFYKDGSNIKLGVMEAKPKIAPVLKQLKDQNLTVGIFLISKSSFLQAFGDYDKVLPSRHRSDAINISGNKFLDVSLQQLADTFSQISPTEIIDEILGAALSLNASDIHIEPAASTVKIRLRIDGVLQDAASLHSDVLHQITSRIKILSKLKLNVSATPQEGSFHLTLDQTPVDVRVSVIPSSFGESIVMRLLRQDKGSLKFEELGIQGLAAERILQEIQKTSGMILSTGPTGSGKTTTLYAILSKLNESGVKIITLEDPVEYKIEGITQTTIDEKSGMTFAMALRAVLRQDPDIIMVGEMRDQETAETASQAALTGHIVLSTLHTNDGPAAIPRLLDLGIKPFVLAPAISSIIGQRLVRKICPECKQEYKLPANLLARVEMILKTMPKASDMDVPKRLVFYHSTGCKKCHGLGYKGRIGIFEVFLVNDPMEKLIIAGATTTEVRKQAIADGMVTMAQDGILKALAGITDVEEVFRVTEE